MAGPVMVLNASWEPISRTKISRAIAMVRAGIAVIHEAFEGETLRTASGEEIPKPKVLRLLRYVTVKVLHQKARWSKKGVLIRDGKKCGYCNSKATTVDHVVPVSKGGGRGDWINTIACCKTCNGRKADKHLNEIGMKLLWEPRVPKKIELITRSHEIGAMV